METADWEEEHIILDFSFFFVVNLAKFNTV